MSNDVKAPRRRTSIARSIFLVCAFTAGFAALGSAQTPSPWRWRLDANIFAGVNHQDRAFTDFTNIESQNWFMGTGERPVGLGQLNVFSMISLEPFTMKKIGSAQVFQTGETYDNQPLIDYQHPHDLLSSLGVSYTRQAGRWTITPTASIVGSPALGPMPFMHRPSAAENLQAPLSHHNLDSTHATPGVLTLLLARGSATIDTSWFHGREPDEHRTDLDLGALDSWSVRGTWKRAGWDAQVSGGRLKNPDAFHPGDVTRLTASVAHMHSGPVSTEVFAAWGQNRETLGPRDAFLFESQLAWLDGHYLFSRAELVTKDIIHITTDHHGIVIDGHPLARIGAFTIGYTRDLNKGMRTRLGLGTDITMYYVPEILKESYGGPVSMHFFVRYRFTSAGMLSGMHHGH